MTGENESSFSEDEKEVAKRARKIQQFRNVNAGLVTEIEQLGGGVDLSVARIEHLIRFLVDQEVISTSQMLDESDDWERSIRPQLISVRDRIKDMIQKAREEERKKTRPAPMPDGGALVLPGNFGGKKSGETRSET